MYKITFIVHWILNSFSVITEVVLFFLIAVLIENLICVTNSALKYHIPDIRKTKHTAVS